jgi:hypothetical protein
VPSSVETDIIVFRFIIEYSSLRDFYRPLGNNNRSIFIWGFLKNDHFSLFWNLRLVIIELWCLEGFWFLLEDFLFLKIIFLHGEIFLNSYHSSFAVKYFFKNVNDKATVWHKTFVLDMSTWDFPYMKVLIWVYPYTSSSLLGVLTLLLVSLLEQLGR